MFPVSPGQSSRTVSPTPIRIGPAGSLPVDREREPVAVERNKQRGPLKLHPELHLLHRRGQPRLEVKDAVADLGSRIGPLHQVNGPCHDADVNPFLGRAALDVLEVAPERHQERSQDFSGSSAARAPANVTKLSVEPWEVRRS